jgi:hypothetical protein
LRIVKARISYGEVSDSLGNEVELRKENLGNHRLGINVGDVIQPSISSMNVQNGPNPQKVTSARSAVHLVILSVTVLQEMQLVIQAVANRGKDMSAERVDQTLIILMIAQSRTRDTQVEIGMATEEVDMVLRRRLDRANAGSAYPIRA